MANQEINNENLQEQDGLENVEGAVTRTEEYIEKNRKTLGTILLAIIVVIAGIWFYNNKIKGPKEEKASAAMSMAEMYFERDSFNLALNGDTETEGFLKIISEYSGSEAANLAKYYAGVCYLRLGQYQEAINKLNDFSCKDPMLEPIAKGCIGDAQMELGDIKKAQSAYKDAINASKDNSFTAPIYMNKLAKAYTADNNAEEAQKIYKEIKTKFPNSNEGRNAEKYIK